MLNFTYPREISPAGGWDSHTIFLKNIFTFLKLTSTLQRHHQIIIYNT